MNTSSLGSEHITTNNYGKNFLILQIKFDQYTIYMQQKRYGDPVI